MRRAFWKTDWFLGLLVVAAVTVLNLSSGLIPSLERKAYDMGVQATSRAPSDKIAVIAIDKASIDNIGRWPWPRDVHASMIDTLARAQAKVIGYTVFFSEPENRRINDTIARLLAVTDQSVQASTAAGTPVNPDTARLHEMLKTAEQDFNTDRKLAGSIAAAGNVALPVLFFGDIPRGRPDKPLPDFVRRNAVQLQGVQAGLPEQTSAIDISVVEPLGQAAAAIGHLNAFPDVDGAIRTEALAVTYFDEYYPSLSAMLVARSLNLGPADIRISAGEAIRIGNLQARTDPQARMYTYFYGDRGGHAAFAEDSFFDVFTGKIPAEKYRDKIVLIGPTAAGLSSLFVTPVNPSMPAVTLSAHTVSSLLQEHFFVVPTWSHWVELLASLAIAAYLIVLLPRLNARAALLVSGALLAALVGAHFGLMVSAGVWLQLMLPATLLVIGHAALVSKRFIVTEAAKVKSDESSAESNRMLGIAYQAQGQLDLAWDKFRQVPMSGAVMDNLYNLALDFERKRQFNKAESVFRHMFEYDPKFRDLESRMSRAKQLSETVILGAGSSHPGGSLNLAAGEKPKFGRFEVQKELGKGAMGVVYLGKDPKIGREVAIKTMALAQEFEPDELAEVKDRFFREAETAGRLSHPHIVTIYDTGEEHDFCYIAMELLKGGDLAPHVKAGNLLPVDRVVSIVARAGEALGYAHKQGVVHRDVKPANMMYHGDTDTLKLTDFGIARLTDSSKTKTGMVLGTPSFMSPEQLAGKKIEGRSDLFSLGVSLYQLLCGRLPFEGESMAQLMYKIANEAPADILAVNPKVPAGLVAFLHRALSKNPDERFQTGEEFAAALRASAAGAASAPPAAPAGGAKSLDIEL
jgi:serine/threonine-protein kinase